MRKQIHTILSDSYFRTWKVEHDSFAEACLKCLMRSIKSGTDWSNENAVRSRNWLHNHKLSERKIQKLYSFWLESGDDGMLGAVFTSRRKPVKAASIAKLRKLANK